MTACLRAILFCLSLLASYASLAVTENEILQLAEQQARQLAAHATGDVRIKAGPVDMSRLPACSDIEAYTPPNSRNLGRVHIGVRCVAQSSWSILVPVHIAVFSTYVETRRNLQTGSNLQADDLQLKQGELSTLPTGTLLRLEDALGKTLRSTLAAHQPLRRHQLITPPVIRQGQSVQVLFRGEGFAISAEGKALNDAAPGEIARARMHNESSGGRNSGRNISGIAQEDGSILLTQ